MDIEKKIFPYSGKLIMKNEQLTAHIVDAELDVLYCDFNNDDCVTIDTENYDFITLSIENLEKLKELIWQAKEKYQTIHANSKTDD